MKGKLRHILLFAVLIALVVSVCSPVLATYGDKDISQFIFMTDKPRGDDPPWDPGDEYEPGPKDPGIVETDDGKATTKLMGEDFLLAKGRRDDPPWDPGDESAGRIKEVNGHA